MMFDYNLGLIPDRINYTNLTKLGSKGAQWVMVGILV